MRTQRPSCSSLGIGISQRMAVVSSVLCPSTPVLGVGSGPSRRAGPFGITKSPPASILEPCCRCAELWFVLWFASLQRGNSLAAGQLHTKLFSDKGKGPPALGALAEGDDDSYATQCPRQQHSRERKPCPSFCPPCRD